MPAPADGAGEVGVLVDSQRVVPPELHVWRLAGAEVLGQVLRLGGKKSDHLNQGAVLTRLQEKARAKVKSEVALFAVQHLSTAL
jgi:hypothetical protein